MMRYILLLLIISFGCSPVFAENRAMKDMCNRLFPEHSGNFTFELAPDSLENDFFTIESRRGSRRSHACCARHKRIHDGKPVERGDEAEASARLQKHAVAKL